MNIPYDEMPEKIEELMIEVERLESENKHLLDLQKSMDKQYEELEKENKQLKEEKEKLDRDRKWYLEKLKERQNKYEILAVELLAGCNNDKLFTDKLMYKIVDLKCEEYENLEKEKDLYKSVLDEIREYIKSHISYEKNSDGYAEPYLSGYAIKGSLEILDKVGKE